MSENKISYKIFVEGEDIKQSRIISCVTFLENLFGACKNSYLKNVEIDNESDLDDFTLRLFVDHTVEEDTCSNAQDAQDFIMDMAEFVDAIAQEQSVMDIEGSFEQEYNGEKHSYKFISEAGQDYCDFEEL